MIAIRSTKPLVDLPSVIDGLTLCDDSVKMQASRGSVKRKSCEEDEEAKEEFSYSKRICTASLDVSECTLFFRRYCNATGDKIDVDGMEKLCEDLQVDPSDIVMLVLAWIMNAEEMCVFRLSEWMSGMAKLGCQNIDSLRRRLPNLETVLTQKQSLKEVFRYAFDFGRSSGERSLEVNIACELLKVIFTHRYCTWSMLPAFTNFLTTSHYQVVNRDQWNNIFEFAMSIDSSFTNYDEEGAWPVMMDEFVAFRRTALGFPTSRS